MSVRINVARDGRHLFAVTLDSIVGNSALVKEICDKFADERTTVTASISATSGRAVGVHALADYDRSQADYKEAFRAWNAAGRPDTGPVLWALDTATERNQEVRAALGY